MSGRDLGRERYWRQVLARRESSGATVRAFCRQEGISESSFHYWRREIARRDAETSCDELPIANGEPVAEQPPARFVPVSIAPSAAPIEIVLPTDVVLRVPGGCDAATLGVVLAALEAAR